ncbi:MAG: NUDIX domain-containing protein [Anaerolineales bacterium]|jgi:8-oxo-dGTP pyrophosphatase MutT (NUDIX family)|nr:NUDIX domain-containing protein [Anaerolineales bacterium]
MRSRFPIAVHLLFIKDEKVLLLRRFNTGYEDGNYSLVAGHVDAGETVTQTAIREAQEEAGVQIAPENIEVVHVIHRKSNDERIDFFVQVNAWDGEIQNMEPDKCDDLSWFPLADLPANIIPYVRFGIENYQKGIFYSEYGW